MRTYEALLSRPEQVAYVKARQRDVERAGGKLHIYAPNKAGLTLIELTLPASIGPQVFFPGLPFSLV
jgi:hypothetical protein